MSDAGPARGFLQRLDAAVDRLSRLAEREPPIRLTEPDRGTGERWDAGQVWAHLAEILPYWMGELDRVASGYRGEAVPFGRVKSDPDRIAAIERGRDEAPPLMERVRHAAGDLRIQLGRLGERGWRAVGVHQTLGRMDASAIVGEFLVGHLEQHADQLEALHRPPP